jgi:hypothetical protein
MSEAREAKQREWRCNIFSQEQSRPLFDRKKRPEGSREGSGVRETFAFAVPEVRSRSHLKSTLSTDQAAAGARNKGIAELMMPRTPTQRPKAEPLTM